MARSLTSFNELFDFYHHTVKKYYCLVTGDNVLPVQTLTELNAALDHISRHYCLGESEEYSVNKAYSHFKRSCFDIFKIIMRETGDKYIELKRQPIGLIDNGNFRRELFALYAKIRKLSQEAKRLEGQKNGSDDTIAFERWEETMELCAQLEDEYYLNPNVDWAETTISWISKKAPAWVAISVPIIALLSLLLNFYLGCFRGNENQSSAPIKVVLPASHPAP